MVMDHQPRSGRLEGCHGDRPPAQQRATPRRYYLDESGSRVTALLKVLLSVLLLDLQSQTRAQDPLVPHNTTQRNTLVCITAHLISGQHCKFTDTFTFI